MTKRGFTFQLGIPQITEALLAYARGMVDCAMYDVAIDVIDETRVDVICTKKRAPRKPRAKGAP